MVYGTLKRGGKARRALLRIAVCAASASVGISTISALRAFGSVATDWLGPVAVESDGDILVVDRLSDSIDVLSQGGLHPVVAAGTAVIGQPRAAAGFGDVAIGKSRLWMTAGGQLLWASLTGDSVGALHAIGGVKDADLVTADGSGNVVYSSDGVLWHLSKNGKRERLVVGSAEGSGAILQPTSLALGGSGYVYVTDVSRGRLDLVREGVVETLTALGGFNPGLVAGADDGAVVGIGNRELYKITGTTLAKVKTGNLALFGTFVQPVALAVSEEGNAYVTVWNQMTGSHNVVGIEMISSSGTVTQIFAERSTV